MVSYCWLQNWRNLQPALRAGQELHPKPAAGPVVWLCCGADAPPLHKGACPACGASYLATVLLLCSYSGLCMQGLWMWSSPVERLNPDGSKYHLVRAATLLTASDRLSEPVLMAMRSSATLASL